jgi:hypothetical protein
MIISVSPVPETDTFIPSANPSSANRFRHPASAIATRKIRPLSPGRKSDSFTTFLLAGAAGRFRTTGGHSGETTGSNWGKLIDTVLTSVMTCPRRLS